MLWENTDHSASEATLQYTMEPKEFENRFLPYDVLTNLAHVTMLHRQGFLDDDELAALRDALTDLYHEADEVDGEDVHTFVEERVTRRTEAGKKMHLARSRNDQIFVDTRLFMKDATIDLAGRILDFIDALRTFAEEKNVLIPGYTHQQQAMPSSTGLWASSYVDALIDDLKSLRATYRIIDSNPLGAAASYGTSLDIDRDLTTELLGFAQKQHNPIYCSNRGKQELQLLQTLDLVMLDVQKFAEDVINFSEDQQFFELADDYTTGSSIMPQKRNPDILELARAKAEEVSAGKEAIRRIIGKLPSGYNRDSQQTKGHLIEGVDTVRATLDILTPLVESMELSDDFEIDEGIFAAYTANQLVTEGMPFRDAYHEVKSSEEYETHDEVAEPVHQPVGDLRTFWADERERFDGMSERLLTAD
ncbi:argininosuccinate lyase [Haloplanus rubicundus]|uniref:Argininosuccinate lyase n=1 Tax=Haloplanus rubicundus TaxID=1547898 RepID=A0A345E478_9EURY|nr:argininosuccinate lyase [Haloplanus rubicundus]AXG07000.1 argininosuccinate lyase [Haloplanus rubicundus]